MSYSSDPRRMLVLGRMLWADTTQPPIPDAGVVVLGGRIAASGTREDLLTRFSGTDTDVVYAQDCVITPAFVNAHHHMYGVLSHGIPLDEAPPGFWPFLTDFWWPCVEDRLTPDLIEAAADWACLEMVRSGVTTFYDCLEAPYAIPGALEKEGAVVERWGLRGVLSFEATERVSLENGQLGLRENARFIDMCDQQAGLVSGMMCFHTTFTCSADFIHRAFSLAEARRARIHMHVSEGVYEPEYCLQQFGQRPLEYYDGLGVLGPTVLASQCVQVDPMEMDILAARVVSVAHQPISNCEVGGGIAPIPEMLARGVNVALGTDGYVNNFFEVMRASALVQRARLLDPRAMPASRAWSMATRSGALALGFEDLGTLVPGNQADLLLIDISLPSPLAPHNLADQLLLWRNPCDIQAVMCAGKWLMRDGIPLGVDVQALRERVSSAAEELWAADNAMVNREGALG
ncbi:MAG: amidohydrolase family protein [Chloroflexi bacterium]|nr:amidohydrolase family protein [Chloroflexota bacterium]